MCRVINSKKLNKRIKIGTRVYVAMMVVPPIASGKFPFNKEGWFTVNMASHNSHLFSIEGLDCLLEPSVIKKFSNK